MLVPNTNQKPKDYDHLKDVYRPSHADYTYEQKYGHRDHRGGGRSSARITAPWVAAGALAQTYLKEKGIEILAYVTQIGSSKIGAIDTDYSREDIDSSIVRCPEHETSKEMEALIADAIEDRDSLGGVIRCVISGIPAGLGDPVFAKAQCFSCSCDV